jgi:hypothetical protein
MLADYFTKPLQGIQFKIFRDQIMNVNPDEDPNQDCRSVLNVAEGEPWTDGGWTKIGSKNKELRHIDVASDERAVGNNGHEEVEDANRTMSVNALKMEHRECNSNGEHGCVCDRDWRRGNQRLNWEIEHIDLISSY